MYKSLIAAFIFLTTALTANEYDVYQKDYRFSTIFEMESHGKSLGTAKKSYWRWLKPLRDTYDIYNDEGDWEATGIGRIFCLGFFRPWGAEFDVYNPKGERIGVIDGQVVTTESAKFSIYNSEGTCVGIAYMDTKNAGFSIFHPDKPTLILAFLRRNFVADETDYWSVTINDEAGLIDPRILKVFTAFAVDKQGYFKEDN